jgi:hypothetical protein
MGGPEERQRLASDDDDRGVEWPDEAVLAEDAARVACAAAELGVEVPDGFLLTGVDEGGHLTAFTPGNSYDFKVGAAILHRLGGAPVDEVLARMSQESEVDPEPRPEWWPPDDWNDREAWDAWMARRARHPEWPNAYNGTGDWLSMLLSGAGITAVAAAAASHMNLRARIGFAKWLLKRAEERGIHPDPVAVLRAFERAAPEPTPETGAPITDSEPPARLPGEDERPTK